MSIEVMYRKKDVSDPFAIDAIRVENSRIVERTVQKNRLNANHHRVVRPDIERRQEHEEAEGVAKLAEGEVAHGGIVTRRRAGGERERNSTHY
jgi:hypothetical protein